MKFTFEECVSKISSKDRSHKEIIDLIYSWVKQDNINVQTMNDLVIHFWKEMGY